MLFLCFCWFLSKFTEPNQILITKKNGIGKCENRKEKTNDQKWSARIRKLGSMFDERIQWTEFYLWQFSLVCRHFLSLACSFDLAQIHICSKRTHLKCYNWRNKREEGKLRTIRLLNQNQSHWMRLQTNVIFFLQWNIDSSMSKRERENVRTEKSVCSLITRYRYQYLGWVDHRYNWPNVSHQHPYFFKYIPIYHHINEEKTRIHYLSTRRCDIERTTESNFR